jgi:receptor expression-enhancing protein 5/6
MEQIASYVATLTEQLDKNPTVKQLADKAGVPSGYIATGAIVTGFLFVFLGVGASLITDAVGIFYPAYMSFKAIESPEADDDKLWLTYWVVFAIYGFADRFLDFVFFWVPFYYPIKLLVLITLFWPQTRFAVLLYDRVIKPFLKKYERDIDEKIGHIQEGVEAAAKKAQQEAVSQGLKLAAAASNSSN